MAGYFIYSLDWDKFRRFVDEPSGTQLLAFAGQVSDGLDELRSGHPGRRSGPRLAERPERTQRSGPASIRTTRLVRGPVRCGEVRVVLAGDVDDIPVGAVALHTKPQVVSFGPAAVAERDHRPFPHGLPRIGQVPVPVRVVRIRRHGPDRSASSFGSLGQSRTGSPCLDVPVEGVKASEACPANAGG